MLRADRPGLPVAAGGRGTGCADQRREEPSVLLVFLGMPLHGDGEGKAGHLDRLDRPVGGTAGDREPGSQPRHRLMMVAPDVHPGADQLSGARARLDAHVDHAEGARGRLMAVMANHVGQMLLQ